MQIKYKNQIYEAEKIVKKDNSIHGYNDGQKVFSFVGIANINDFEGEYIEEITDKKRLEALEQAMLEMVLGGM